jgi:hypothetical protein
MVERPAAYNAETLILASDRCPLVQRRKRLTILPVLELLDGRIRQLASLRRAASAAPNDLAALSRFSRRLVIALQSRNSSILLTVISDRFLKQGSIASAVGS